MKTAQDSTCDQSCTERCPLLLSDQELARQIQSRIATLLRFIDLRERPYHDRLLVVRDDLVTALRHLQGESW